MLELLYDLFPGYWGRGFATGMSRAILALAFDRHELDAVDTAVDAPNVASLLVLRRLGLTEVGCSPGAFGTTLHFRLARGDWDRGHAAGDLHP